MRTNPIDRAATVFLLLATLACSAGDANDTPGQEPDSAPAAAAGDTAAAPPVAPDTGSSVALTIYFTRDEVVVPVERQVPADSVSLAAALRHLLAGPRPDERAAGLQSWFSDATAGTLRSVTLDPDGRAVIDFADLRPIIPNASSSAGSAMLLAELNATVFEHSAIQSVEYRIDGSCATFGDWLQRGCLVIDRPPIHENPRH